MKKVLAIFLVLCTLCISASALSLSSGSSGETVRQLQQALNVKTILVSVGVTALISGLTIGGKALGKNFAISKSTRVVYWTGRLLNLFHR